MSNKTLSGFFLASVLPLVLVDLQPAGAYADDGNAHDAAFTALADAGVVNLPAAASEPSDTGGHQYGPWGLFDDRTMLGTGFFPEPFLVDEGDLDKELSLDWLHQEGHGAITDQVTAEVEWSFGLTTIEVEVPYERDTFPGTDPVTGMDDTERTEGMDAFQITVRHPIWEWVSADEKVDNSVVVAFELGVPTNSPVGKDTELVPELFDLLRLGDHFALQTHVGFSTLLGSDPSDERTLEYSADFSYQIDRTNIALPHGLLAIVPMIELAGERNLNKGDLSDNLTGVLGARFNLNSIGSASPRLGIGYVFPVDEQSRQDFSWGVVTSLVFDL